MLWIARFAGGVALTVKRLASPVLSCAGPWTVTAGLLVSTTTFGAEQADRARKGSKRFMVPKCCACERARQGAPELRPPRSPSRGLEDPSQRPHNSLKGEAKADGELVVAECRWVDLIMGLPNRMRHHHRSAQAASEGDRKLKTFTNRPKQRAWEPLIVGEVVTTIDDEASLKPSYFSPPVG